MFGCISIGPYSIMWRMDSSKRLSTGIVLFVVLAITYFVGFNSGHQSSQQALTVSIDNKDVAGQASTTADFGIFWKAWNILNQKYAGTTTTDQERVYGAIEGMTAAMGDPYTIFFPPEESKSFNEEISGNFEGVGMEIGVREGKLAVVTPIKNSPAEKAGVKAGDFIAKIDDTDSLTISTDKAVKLIRGKGGTKVKLTLIREGVEEPIIVTITRSTIDIPVIKTELKKDVFIISLYTFSANSANLFRNALKEFIDSGAHKLVLDLRGNPGGYLESAVDMASWFLPSGKIVLKEEFGKGKEERLYRSKGYDIFTDKLRMMILVNEGSASASEILAGALSENDVADLVGAKTFGKGSVQELVSLTSDTSLKVTIARWLTPLGHSISNVGITPEYVVERTTEDIKAQRDPQLDKALELLAKQP